MNQSSTRQPINLSPEEEHQRQCDDAQKAEREFWLDFRSGLLMMVSAIDKRYKVKPEEKRRG